MYIYEWEGQSRRKRDRLDLWWASSKLNTRMHIEDWTRTIRLESIKFNQRYIYIYIWGDSSTLARSRGTKCCVKVWLGSRGMSWIIQGSGSVDGGKTIDLQVKRTRVSYLVKWKKNEGKENENWLYIYIYIYIRFELFKPSLETAMTTTRDKHETNELRNARSIK